MHIERLKRKDVAQYSMLFKSVISDFQYYPSHAQKQSIKKRTPLRLQQRLADEKRVILTAKETKGNLVGFCDGKFEKGGVFWLGWIGVAKTHRQKGVASSLLSYLIKILSKPDIHKIYCFVPPRNQASKALFSKHEFEKAGLLKKHWYKLDYEVWHRYL